MGQCRRRLGLPVEHGGIVLACCIELGRQTEAAFQQFLSRDVLAQPPRHLGKHAQRRHVGRIDGQVSAQPAICQRQIVVHQRSRRFLQARVAGRDGNVSNPCFAGAVLVTIGLQIVRQEAPSVGRRGIELQCPAKRGDCARQMTRLRARHSKLQIDGGGVRQLAAERFEHIQSLPGAPSSTQGGP